MNPRRSIQQYKRTLFDKYGPDAGNTIMALTGGIFVTGMTFPMFVTLASKLVSDNTIHPSWWLLFFVPMCSIGSGAIAMLVALSLGRAAGGAYKHLMVNGTSTPYKPQYSIQESMVAQGRIDDAIDSYEAILAEQPEEVDARVRTAELYARRGDHRRALELFRQAQALPTIETGKDVYVSFMMIDLYDGPLGDRGRAIVELRRLIDRHPDSPVAARAKEALAKLKAEHIKIE